ncbi:MAG: response regulator, partial [Rectinemataceae bacterium]|nr:response regulator [Rectinemataceae bacterium]
MNDKLESSYMSQDEKHVIPRQPENEECFNPLEGLDEKLVDALKTSYFGVSGALPRVPGTSRDIAEREKAEEVLKNARQFHQDLMDAIPSPIFYKDTKGIYLGGNKAFERFLGLSPGQYIGKTAYEIAPADLAEKYDRADRELLKNQGVQTYEASVVYADGTRHDVVFNKATFTDSENEVAGLIGVILDITERKKAEEEVRRLTERINQTRNLEALGVLVAGVAHNLNNVLAIIMAAASIHEPHAAESGDAEIFRTIDSACRRGREVLKSLMLFAKPANSWREPFGIHGMIEKVCGLLDNTNQSRIEIRKVLATESLWSLGDAEGFFSALMNLCHNALDSMPDGGTLTIRTAIPENDWMEIHIEDSGCGMTPEVLAHALDPFFTTKSPDKGTGLGLSVAYGVVKANGGSMEISSNPGRGTSVRLRISRIPVPIQKEDIQVPDFFPVIRNVLLVDDDEDVRFLVDLMLEKAGFKVFTVRGGEEALESLRAGTVPDLVILDQNMPGMNGIQTMERIRVLYPDLPILISSGQPYIQDWPCFKRP